MNLSRPVSGSADTDRLTPGLGARGLTALCLLLAAAGPAAGETNPGVTSSATLPRSASLVPVGVSTRVDRATAQIADRIALTIVVRSPAGVQISFPAAPQRLGEFEVVNVRETLDIPVEEGRESTRTYELECLLSGNQTIPAVAIPWVDTRGTSRAHGVAQSEPVDVSITSLLEGQVDPTQFRDIKGIVALHRPSRGNTNRWLAAAAIGTLLAAAGALVIRRQRNTPLSPEQWAWQEIRRVETQSAAEPIDVQAFYVQLTTIVRIYVEGKVGIAAPRLTTAEFFEHLQAGQSLPQDHVLLLRDFLTTADLVKFAGLMPRAADIAAACLKARQFVEETSCHVSNQEIA